MKFFNKRTLLLVACTIAVIGIAAIGGIVVYVSSPEFKETARQYAVREIERQTGGHATLGRLYWNLWTQRVTLLDLTIRGTESSDRPPLAHIESIEVGVNFRSLLQKKVDLFELTVTRPEIHLLVDERGNTNLPSPPPRDSAGRADYQISIRNFKVAHGIAEVNERRINIDFVVKNLNSDLSYQSLTHILNAHVSYDGVLARTGQSSIPYSLSSDFDFTRGTILAKHIVISSGKSQVQLQGKVDDALTGDIAGKLDYSGNAEISFMQYFFPDQKFAGDAVLAGALDFNRKTFHTGGTVKSGSLRFNEWDATAMRGKYDYRFPEKRLTLDELTIQAFGGTAAGSISVDPVPGAGRVTLGVAYSDLDGTMLARVFPWDKKYRIESRVSGKLAGWFEGGLKNYEFSGDATMVSSAQKPAAEVMSFPLDGGLSFSIRPGQANVSNANLHFLSTSLVANGPIDTNNLNLSVHMASSDLSNLRIIYPDANGTGSFDGVVTGPIKTPRAEGTFDVLNYRYKDWTIEHASGMAILDTLSSTATLNDVRVVQGQSQIVLNGTTTFDGAKVDLRVQTAQLRSEDVEPFVKQKFGGVLSGAIHLTSLTPLRFDGDIRAVGLALQGQTIREAQSHIQYDAPALTLQNLSVSDGGSSLTGRASYNSTTEAMSFAVRINSVDLSRLRPFGMPEAVEGRVQQADLTGSGTRMHPEVDGTARLQNIKFGGESFPTARVDVNTSGSMVNVKVSETRNLEFSADIDTARNGYPFVAKTKFKQYSIEKLAKFSRGTLTVSGDADLKGSLNDMAHVSGAGHIDPLEMGIQDQTLRSTKPFAFDFNSERLNLTDVSLVNATGTEMNLSGTIGLTEGARLNLTAKGEIDAGLLVQDKSWNIGGAISVRGQIEGTVAKPDLQGVASFSDLSISRQGVTTSLTALKGDVLFNQQRMTLQNVEGRSGPGTIRVQGYATIEGNTIGALNFRVNASSVRVRYPAGLRSVVDGSVVVGGTLASPSVSGDVDIQSLTFNSSFDEFLALFESGVGSESMTSLGNLQLSLHVVGSRNISIKNELGSAEARVDLSVKGTLDRPALTGRVETNSGKLLFQGKTYNVTRGNVNFVDPVRIDPAIDIQAETSIRSYQVFLSVSGRADRLQLNLRSEPPLSQLEIVSLISGGKTTDEFRQSASSDKLKSTPTGEQAFQGGAASILSDMLVTRVGSKFNLLGLDRIVRVDPVLGADLGETTARVTVPLQLTKDLSVMYSQVLESNKQQVIQVEYFVTKNVSILASKDENNTNALDLRIRKRF